MTPAFPRCPACTGLAPAAPLWIALEAMQLQIDVSRHDPQRLTIIDSVDRPVLIVIAEPDMFMGEKAPAKPDDKPTEPPAGDENVKPFKGR